MIVALLAATVLLADVAPAVTPAAGAPTAKAAAPTTAQKTADANTKLVCKSEPVLGSRMPVKKCRTVGDAAAEKLEAQQALERMQGDNAYSSK
jgi:N-acetylglutamate synthase/N-acetylornithine aminotransferase